MREGIPRFYRVGQASIPSGKAVSDAGDRAEDIEQWKEKMEAVTAKLIDENNHHKKLLVQQGHQLDKVIRMIEGLVHDIQETKEVQVYTIDPQAYKELTGRDRPEGLEKEQKAPPATSNKEQEALPQTSKEVSKPPKAKKPKKDQKDTPPKDDSKRSQKKSGPPS